jgi:hypothetical protein
VQSPAAFALTWVSRHTVPVSSGATRWRSSSAIAEVPWSARHGSSPVATKIEHGVDPSAFAGMAMLKPKQVGSASTEPASGRSGVQNTSLETVQALSDDGDSQATDDEHDANARGMITVDANRRGIFPVR